MMNKINWFDANRSMSTCVAEYMVAVFWKKTIQLKIGSQIKENRESLEKVDNLKGSILADQIPELKKHYLAEIGRLQEEMNVQIEREATYNPTTADVEFKKALEKYAKGKTSVTPAESIQKWFLLHGLDIPEDSYIIREILTAAGEKFRFDTAVDTDGKVVTGFNAGNCYKMTFAKCYEHMVNAGTIKGVQIPEIIREKYAPKKKNNKKNK